MKTESGMEFCASCVHFGFCMVYWGVECKRQGGKRIPRMKPTPADIHEKSAQPRRQPVQVSSYGSVSLKAAQPKGDKSKTTRKPEMTKKLMNIFEPIRTRAANW